MRSDGRVGGVGGMSGPIAAHLRDRRGVKFNRRVDSNFRRRFSSFGVINVITVPLNILASTNSAEVAAGRSFVFVAAVLAAVVVVVVVVVGNRVD